jgi:hypothetical protein
MTEQQQRQGPDHDRPAVAVVGFSKESEESQSYALVELGGTGFIQAEPKAFEEVRQ